MADVRFGSKADIGACPGHVRFTPKSGHCGAKLLRCILAIPGRRAADGETDEPPGSVVSTSRGGPPVGTRLHHAAIGAMRALRGSNGRFDPDFGLPLACLYRDNRWHQLLLWIPNRLQEKPLEVGRCTRVFLCARQISREGVATIS